MAIKEWFTAQELAGMPDMPGTDRGVRMMFQPIQKNLGVSRTKVRGKGLEYAFKFLPTETQAHIRAQAVANVLACLPAEPAPAADLAPVVAGVNALATRPASPSSAYQTNSQRAIADARQAVLRAVRLLQDQAGVTARAAMLAFLTQAAAGRLNGDVASAMLTLARDGRGVKSKNNTGLPSLRTLQGWLARAESAEPGDNLAPRVPQPSMTVEPWMVLAVELKRKAQKPTTSLVHRQLADAWPQFSVLWVQKDNARRGGSLLNDEQASRLAAMLTLPSYDQLARFFREKFSQIDLLQGQHQGSTLRSHKFYQHRTNAGMEPFLEVHADGWNTHFNAPHPITGDYVTYEVWHFHDVATRYTTPFSIGMSESAEVILKGLENCVRFGGIPAIWQTDSTGSVKNDKVSFDPVASLSARAGLVVVHPQTVGNSQANGISENYNKYLDRESRALTTYQNPKTMDSLAFKQVRKFTGQMVKAAKKGDTEAHASARAAAQRVGKGILFESREQMVQWLDEVRVRGNNTPHSALRKITDPTTGRVRHQTPQEAMNEAIAKGWRPVALDEASVIELFMPHFRKTVTRETVSPFAGQRYHHACLGEHNGREVMVAVDSMDGTRVWVKDLHGRLICEAQFVEATGYRSQSMYEFALETRMNAQIKRKTLQIEAIQNRMDPERSPVETLAIEVQAGRVLDFMPMPMPERVCADPAPALASSPDDALMRMYAEQAEQDEKDRLENAEDGPDRLFLMMRAEQDERERQEQEESEGRKAG